MAPWPRNLFCKCGGDVNSHRTPGMMWLMVFVVCCCCCCYRSCFVVSAAAVVVAVVVVITLTYRCNLGHAQKAGSETSGWKHCIERENNSIYVVVDIMMAWR